MLDWLTNVEVDSIEEEAKQLRGTEDTPQNYKIKGSDSPRYS